jgi:ComF family protein
MMSERLSLDNEPTTLVPIPLHPRRLRERGYNQANLVAKKISQLLQLPMRTDMLQRNKYTSPQSQLDFHHRRRNLRSAFICHEVDMPRHITLIDDVMTSGETLKSATKALKYHGVQHVQVWTIARAISHH